MTLFQLSVVAILVSLTCAPVLKGGLVEPSGFDSLLLPEAADGEIYLLLSEFHGDHLIDEALARRSDARFAIGTRARDQLWRLLSRASDANHSQSIWRQDHLDELNVAMQSGSIQVKTEVPASLQFATASLRPAVDVYLRGRLNDEKACMPFLAIVKAVGDRMNILTQADLAFLEARILDKNSADPALYQAFVQQAGHAPQSRPRRYTPYYALVRDGARAVLQSQPDVPLAVDAVESLEPAGRGAIAEAMLNLTRQQDSIFMHATPEEKATWLTTLTQYLVHPDSAGYVNCCLVEAVGGLYVLHSSLSSETSAMLIAAIQSHMHIESHIKSAAGEMIQTFDPATAVPTGWIE